MHINFNGAFFTSEIDEDLEADLEKINKVVLSYFKSADISASMIDEDTILNSKSVYLDLYIDEGYEIYEIDGEVQYKQPSLSVFFRLHRQSENNKEPLISKNESTQFKRFSENLAIQMVKGLLPLVNLNA